MIAQSSPFLPPSLFFFPFFPFFLDWREMTRKRHPVGIKNDANAFSIEAPTVSIENHVGI